MKPGLTALGTAAVLGIYAAGFALTDEAAHGLEGVTRAASGQSALLEGSEAGQPSAAGSDATSGALDLDGGDRAGAGSSGTLPNVAAVDPDGRGSAPQGSTAALTRGGAPPVAAGPRLAAASASSPSSSPPTSATASTGAAAREGAGTPAASARSGSAATPTPSSTETQSASAAESSQSQSQPATGSTAPAPTGSSASDAPAPQPESPYLDGKYTARGIRTGHGTIEATVEIAGGRIVAAAVSTCNMRWPCTDVDPLIPRIIRAQRPGVPTISGATQSSDAFTTAVNEALNLARAAKTAQSPSS